MLLISNMALGNIDTLVGYAKKAEAGALFERTVLSPPKVSPLVAQLHPEAADVFRDSYLVEFLGLPNIHSEADLHGGLVEHLKDFLVELGRD